MSISTEFVRNLSIRPFDVFEQEISTNLVISNINSEYGLGKHFFNLMGSSTLMPNTPIEFDIIDNTNQNIRHCIPSSMNAGNLYTTGGVARVQFTIEPRHTNGIASIYIRYQLNDRRIVLYKKSFVIDKTKKNESEIYFNTTPTITAIENRVASTVYSANTSIVKVDITDMAVDSGLVSAVKVDYRMNITSSIAGYNNKFTSFGSYNLTGSEITAGINTGSVSITREIAVISASSWYDFRAAFYNPVGSPAKDGAGNLLFANHDHIQFNNAYVPDYNTFATASANVTAINTFNTNIGLHTASVNSYTASNTTYINNITAKTSSYDSTNTTLGYMSNANGVLLLNKESMYTPTMTEAVTMTTSSFHYFNLANATTTGALPAVSVLDRRLTWVTAYNGGTSNSLRLNAEDGDYFFTGATNITIQSSQSVVLYAHHYINDGASVSSSDWVIFSKYTG